MNSLFPSFSSYCFEESTQSAQQGESEVHESPTPSPKHSPVQIKTSDLKGPGSSALPDVAKQKITSCNNNAAAALHGILTSSPLTPASVAPSSVVVTTASSQLSTLHHVTYHQKGPAVSQIESSISHTAAAPGVGRGSGGGGSVLTHSKQHQHQRFVNENDYLIRECEETCNDVTGSYTISWPQGLTQSAPSPVF